MSTQIINETFSLQLPDTFEPIPAEELRRLSEGGGDPVGWGARDRENHVMVLAMWKQYPALLARLADPKALAKKNEQLTRRLYEGHGYRLLGFFSGPAAGGQGEGYRFAYTAENNPHVRGTLLVKHGRTVYSFLIAGREENMNADQETFRRITESLKAV